MYPKTPAMVLAAVVLILVVMEDGLVLTVMKGTKNTVEVLILIVVDDGLVQIVMILSSLSHISLNPYCSGQWSRTISELTDGKEKAMS